MLNLIVDTPVNRNVKTVSALGNIQSAVKHVTNGFHYVHINASLSAALPAIAVCIHRQLNPGVPTFILTPCTYAMRNVNFAINGASGHVLIISVIWPVGCLATVRHAILHVGSHYIVVISVCVFAVTRVQVSVDSVTVLNLRRLKSSLAFD